MLVINCFSTVYILSTVQENESPIVFNTSKSLKRIKAIIHVVKHRPKLSHKVQVHSLIDDR